MKKQLNKVILVLVCLTLLVSAGCVSSVENFAIQPPKIAYVPFTHKQLKSLPKPMGKIPVSVYKFMDQTGQYKPLPNVSSFSTAVTQGATSLLVQSLENSSWFLVLEREGLQNLLTERKIVRASLKKKNGGNSGSGLPTLEYGRIILQGGITSYETNSVTGGLGAEYWGLGAHVEYRQDRVTVHLRAVDIHTGRVLKSISTSKTILSKKVQAALFRFISFKRLLEIEAGFTTNEPVQMCVASAIDKAVISLIVAGVADGLWSLENLEDKDNQIFKDYLMEMGREDYLAEEFEKPEQSTKRYPKISMNDER